MRSPGINGCSDGLQPGFNVIRKGGRVVSLFGWGPCQELQPHLACVSMLDLAMSSKSNVLGCPLRLP